MAGLAAISSSNSLIKGAIAWSVAIVLYNRTAGVALECESLLVAKTLETQFHRAGINRSSVRGITNSYKS